MIPFLLISDDKVIIDDYVNKFKNNALFFEVIPKGNEYSIDDIKSIIKETKVFYPKTRIYFFCDFHLSSIPAQNSFLKLLEEPPSNIQFILSTNNKNGLLPTIISRTKIVKLQRSDKQNPVGTQFVVPLIEGLINQTSTGIPLAKFKITDKEMANNFLLQIILFFRGRLGIDKNSPLILKKILQLKGLLESNNLNPQLTIDQALIFIWKKYRMKI